MAAKVQYHFIFIQKTTAYAPLSLIYSVSFCLKKSCSWGAGQKLSSPAGVDDMKQYFVIPQSSQKEVVRRQRKKKDVKKKNNNSLL